MSQSIITLAFEQYKASCESQNKTVVLDEFVLANIPGQNHSQPIDRNEGLPTPAQIVHVSDVSQCGYINGNAVVYSLIMDTRIGDFEFNWIGLRNKESGVLAAISHIPTIHKTKTINGTQNGNAITRSILMSYVGAKTLANIDVDASTWQIDFTARLTGMDERERLANIDHYGQAAFLSDGFKVVKSGSTYKASAGIGYVGGLRCYSSSDMTVNNVQSNGAIYLKASWQGQLTSQWQTVYELVYSKTPLQNVVDSNGIEHYVIKLAFVDHVGDITDFRKVEGFSEYYQQNVVDDLLKSVRDLAESKITKEIADEHYVAANNNGIRRILRGETVAANEARRYEIGRFFVDTTRWHSNGTIIIEVYNTYYDSHGYKKYSIRWGYEYDSGDIKLVEAFGTGSKEKVIIGQPVVSGSVKYIPIYLEQSVYNRCTVVLNTGFVPTSDQMALNGQCYLPTPMPYTVIPTFFSDEQVKIERSVDFLDHLKESGERVFSPHNKPKKTDVELDELHNWPATSDVSDKSEKKYATAAGVNIAYEKAAEALEVANESVPVGVSFIWPLSTPPPGWLERKGQSFDKLSFPELAKIYPSGRLDDMRGKFIGVASSVRPVGNTYLARGAIKSVRSHYTTTVDTNTTVTMPAAGQTAQVYAGSGSGSDNAHSYITQEPYPAHQTHILIVKAS